MSGAGQRLLLRFGGWLVLLPPILALFGSVFLRDDHRARNFMRWAEWNLRKLLALLGCAGLLAISPPMLFASRADFGPAVWPMRAAGALCVAGAGGALALAAYGGFSGTRRKR